MGSTGTPTLYWRTDKAQLSRLARALLVSVVAHLLIIGTYHGGKRVGWWEHWRAPAWMQSAKMLTQLLRKPKPAESRSPELTPLVFIEVNPAAAAAEPPPNAKFYSDKNALAANPEAEKETDVPKITGKQDKVAKTEDVPKETFRPLQPSLPAQPARQEQEEERGRPAEKPGDLAMARPNPAPQTGQGQAQRSRPRTVREALARQEANPNRIPGEKMLQEGGVQRRSRIASLDTKATPFGAYDAALVEAISRRWYGLLDERDYAAESRGKVVIQFQLHYDGRVTDVHVAENTAGEMLALLCERAVSDPAPYAPWTGEMRRLMGDLRKIQFTFYYN